MSESVLSLFSCSGHNLEAIHVKANIQPGKHFHFTLFASRSVDKNTRNKNLNRKAAAGQVRLAVTAAVVNINTPQQLSLASFPISQNQRTEEWQSGYSLRRKIGTPLN